MHLDWTQLRAADLPAPLDEIAEHLGEEVTDRLASLGAPSIPDGAADKLGMALAWAVADALGGTVVYVPVLSELERDARDRAIYDAHLGGLGGGQLTRKFGVSRRTVKRAIRRFEPEVEAAPARRRRSTRKPPPSPGLFDGL